MTIAEFKKLMTDGYIANETVRDVYGLQAGQSFEDQFSVVSLESIIFSNVATSMFVMQELLEQFKKDVSVSVNDQMPGTSRWYVFKSLLFQFGKDLVAETDCYDNTGLTDAQVDSMRVVKFAAAVESRDRSLLFIKVATGDNDGNRFPLSPTQLTAFKQYISDIQYAGVRIQIVNNTPDNMRLEMDIYYDPLVLNGHGGRLDGASTAPVQDAIRAHLKNLPFNGMFTNQGLVDVLQALDGVHIAEIKYSGSRFDPYVQFTQINAREIANAGYYRLLDENLTLNFIADEQVL